MNVHLICVDHVEDYYASVILKKSVCMEQGMEWPGSYVSISKTICAKHSAYLINNVHICLMVKVWLSFMPLCCYYMYVQ